MDHRNRLDLVVLASVMAFTAGGCNISNLIPPVVLDLEGAGSSQFDVQAGTPSRKTIIFGGIESPVTFSGGTFSMDVSALSLTPSDTTQNKRPVAAQTTGSEICLQACQQAGVDAADCSTVCDSNVLMVNVWVGSSDAINADCENGDKYEFIITLDQGDQPVSVSVSPNQATQATLDLLTSAGGFGMCIEVISPVDGTVVIGSILFNIQL